MSRLNHKNDKRAGARPSVGARIIEGLQEILTVLQKGEPLEKHFTCRRLQFDLQPTSYNARRVKETRDRLGASQAVFAQLLGVSVKTIRAWEQGVNEPNGMACRFMDEIRRDPEHWLARLREAAVVK